jgi:hypothetical protein
MEAEFHQGEVVFQNFATALLLGATEAIRRAQGDDFGRIEAGDEFVPGAGLAIGAQDLKYTVA